MVRHSALSTDIGTAIGNHTFHATSIAAELNYGGTLENVEATADHASPRTTQVYARHPKGISADEVGRICF